MSKPTASHIVLICPVARTRATVLIDEEPAGTPTFLDLDEAEIEAPEGWGRVTLERVVQTPGYAEREARRESMRERVRAELAASDVPEEDHAVLLETAFADLDTKLPALEPLSVERRVWTIGPEALNSVAAWLKSQGFFPEGA